MALYAFLDASRSRLAYADNGKTPLMLPRAELNSIMAPPTESGLDSHGRQRATLVSDAEYRIMAVQSKQ